MRGWSTVRAMRMIVHANTDWLFIYARHTVSPLTYNTRLNVNTEEVLGQSDMICGSNDTE